MRRRLAIIPVCFISLAMLTTSSVGLNRGVVLCRDSEGHLALELAHVRHAHVHNEGADHPPHEFPVDADHAGLHAALNTCSDAVVATVEQRATRSESVGLLEAQAAPCLIAPVGDVRTALRSTIRNDSAAAARAELACLSGIVLLV